MVLADTAAASCVLDTRPDAPFEITARAERVMVSIEVWAAAAPAGWAESVFEALSARGLAGTLVIPADPPDEARTALITLALDGGHAVAVALRRAEAPSDKPTMRALRRQLKPLNQLVRTRAVVSPVRSRTAEALLGKAGFRVILEADGPATAEPRMAGLFDGQPRTRVAVPSGPYEGACGSDPRVAPFGPAAADRATLAIVRAARAPGTPVVRVALSGAGGLPTDAGVLGRWLDQVVIPSGAAILSADQLRGPILRGFQRPDSVSPPPQDGGRLVSVVALRQAAAALVGATAVPPEPAPGVNPTEVFHGFVELLAKRVEGDAVRVDAMAGPSAEAGSSLNEPIELSAESVRAVAAQFAAAMPAEVPSAIPVAGRLLTASEFLVALAGAVRGEDPIRVDPIGVGATWGRTTLP